MILKLKHLFKNKYLAFLAIAFLIGSGYYVLNYIGYLDWVNKDSITVVGTSNGSTPNQVATFTGTVMAINSDKSSAVDDMNRKVADVLAAVKDAGVPDADVKTQNINVYQEQVWNQTKQISEYKDWHAATDITIKLHDIKKASSVATLLASSKLDVSNLYGPNLTVENTSKTDADLLSLALLDARQKAEALATASGRSLGKVMNVTENSYGVAVPIMYDNMMAKGMGGGGGTSVSPGSTDITKSVTVTFKLR
ncbi:MAG TPA: SIMPL domain-containing protein [Candidatus Saccharimonadales bacterium]|nr:SIMPL domain-containing protein [Candidatus Saccharimonadales bacterium]